jgi:hypothetical protein
MASRPIPPTVYCISNSIIGKVYIGKTTLNLKSYLRYQLLRAAEGKTGKPHLYNTMRKYPYGWEIEALVECVTDEDAYRKEILFISMFDTFNNGMNCCRGGLGPNSGMRLSEEHKRKISQANIGRKRTKEQKEYLSKALTGRKNPHKGMIWTEESRANMSKAMIGRIMTPEHRRNLSLAAKRRCKNETV